MGISKIKQVVIGVAAIIIIAIVWMIAVGNKPINKWNKLIKTESYESAADYYLQSKDSMNTDDLNTVMITATEAANNVFAKYLNGEIEYEVAISQLSKLQSIDIVSEKVSVLITSADKIKKSREEYSIAEGFFENGEYDKAIEHFNNVIPEDEINYENALSKLEESENKYRDLILESAKDYEEKGDLNESQAIIDVGLEILKDDPELIGYKESLIAKVDIAATKELVDEAEELYNSGDIELAMTTIAQYTGDDPDAVVLKSKIEASYVELVLEDISDLISEEKIDDAKTELQEAYKLVPDNESIDNWLSIIDEYYPVELTDLSIHKTDNNDGNLYNKGNWRKDENYDNLGNTVFFGICYYVSYTEFAWESCTYTIDGKYDIFTGVFSPIRNEKDKTHDNEQAVIEIYGDGNLLYSSDEINGESYPIEFSVDISDVKELEYRIVATGDFGFAILNPTLKKII